MTCCISGRQGGGSILPAIWSCHNLTWSPPRLVMRLSDSTTVRKNLHTHSDFSLSSCLAAFRLISINLKRQSQGWLYLIFIQACLMCLTDWEVRNISQGFSFTDFPFYEHILKWKDWADLNHVLRPCLKFLFPKQATIQPCWWASISRGTWATLLFR